MTTAADDRYIVFCFCFPMIVGLTVAMPTNVRVYRRRGERFADACIIEWDRFGGGSVLIWGRIIEGNKTRLIVINGNITAQTYINDVLAVEPLPFIQFHGPWNNLAVFGDKYE